MANNTRDLRRQIRSVRNTAQLTRAMKMVSAAKLRRAQEAMLAARPYAETLRRVLADVALRARPELNPLLAVRPERKVDLIVLCGDRGLAGAFNANILRTADHWRAAREEDGTAVSMTIVGRKAADYYKSRPGAPVRRRLTDVSRLDPAALARDLSDEARARFVGGEADAVFVVYNQFRSTISQKVVVEPLLPLAEVAGREPASFLREGIDFLYEPEAERLLAGLLERYVAFSVFHSLLESGAAEHAARMTSMDNATRNANELISKLTLLLNRIRQASITNEIIEVVSGANALG